MTITPLEGAGTEWEGWGVVGTVREDAEGISNLGTGNDEADWVSTARLAMLELALWGRHRGG